MDGCTDCGKPLHPDEFWLCFECKAQAEFITQEFDAEAARRDEAGFSW